MELFFITFGAMLVAVFAMAIGVIFGRLPIAGSCGGLNTVDGSCQSCSRPCRSRRRSRRKSQRKSRARAIGNTSDQSPHRTVEHPVLLHRHEHSYKNTDTGTGTDTTMESIDAQSN